MCGSTIESLVIRRAVASAGSPVVAAAVVEEVPVLLLASAAVVPLLVSVAVAVVVVSWPWLVTSTPWKQPARRRAARARCRRRGLIGSSPPGSP